MSWWIVIGSAFAYGGILFAIASYGDWRSVRRGGAPAAQPMVYALSLAVYCTSWTLFGSVGWAARNGLDFLAIYVGPLIVLLVLWSVVRKIVRISKAQNLTSIADFIGARYGKSQSLAALVTLITIVGVTPYIALQLKAVVSGYEILVSYPEVHFSGVTSWWRDAGFWVAIFMAAFAILFGARSIDATEHHEGMILAVAFESVVKLLAFLAVGIYVTWGVFDGPSSFLVLAEQPAFSAPVHLSSSWVTLTTLVVLSMAAFVILPRQFHVMVVENNHESELRRAVWVLPLYFILINLFVVPIALTGMVVVGEGSHPDLYILTVPLQFDMPELALLAYIGGLSAATGMIVVATVAMATMVSNHIVMPFLLRQQQLYVSEGPDLTRTILFVRRSSIIGILILGWLYYRWLAEGYALSTIGMTSFAAAAQFVPAVVAGLYWRRGTRWGVVAGLFGGFAIWFDSLLLPTLGFSQYLDSGVQVMGFMEWTLLSGPEAVIDLDPMRDGVVASLLLNVVLFVGVSLLTPLPALERFQAEAFIHPLVEHRKSARSETATVSVAEIHQLLERFLGYAQAADALQVYQKTQNVDLSPIQRANMDLLDFTERALSRVIGASSARVVVASIVGGATLQRDEVAAVLSDASMAIRHNHDLLQTTMDTVRQGILAFDDQHRLILWNKTYLHLFSLSESDVQTGMTLAQVMQQLSPQEGPYAVSGQSSHADMRVRSDMPVLRPGSMGLERTMADGSVLEIHTTPMPEGGSVLTVTDVTERAQAARVLKESKGELEARVEERTRALTLLNTELDQARKQAEDANIGKTRFLAAASHDLLQPLNAARLFASALEQKLEGSAVDDLVRRLATSLTSVEELLAVLLDISKLDAGGTQPEMRDFAISEVLDALMLEFTAVAEEKGLGLSVHGSNFWVRSDPRLLRRILQNLIANALKYTEQGRVVIGCRWRGAFVRIDVVDTGPGIPEDKLSEIFLEFSQLTPKSGEERPSRGLGLGLAIVDRLAQLLAHKLAVRSQVGKGSTFSVMVPRAEPRDIPQEVPKIPHRSQQHFMNRRLLVLDNEPEVLEGMRALLQSWGCDVVTAATPSEAARVSLTHHPELMVVDYHLDDGATGVNAAQDMFRTQPEVPVVVVTADYTEDLRHIVQDAGFYLARKPIKPAGFRALLTRLLFS